MRLWARILLLIAALGAVVVAAHLPRWDPWSGDRQPYPVHLDEYVHWGYAKAIAESGSLEFRDPFGDAYQPAEASVKKSERAFQTYLAAFRLVSGVDWLPLLEWWPAGVALVLALGVYAIAHRWGAGLAAVTALAIAPTTLRFLGPGFVVPIMFGFALAIGGFLALLYADRHPGLLLPFGAIAAATWWVHPAAALLLTLGAGVVAMGLAARAGLRAATVGGILVLLLLAAFPLYEAYLDVGWSAPALGAAPGLILQVGATTLLLAAAGGALVTLEGDAHARAVGAALVVTVVLAEFLILYRNVTGLDPFRLYDRSYTWVLLATCILAGFGAAAAPRAARAWRKRDPRVPAYAPIVAASVVGLLLVASVAQSWKAQAESPRYVVMTDADAEAWAQLVERGVPPGRALVDGIGGIAFLQITGMRSVFLYDPSTTGTPPHIERFFREGAANTTFLVETGTTVVVTHRPVTNPDLQEVAPSVYELRADYVERMFGPTP